MSKVVQAEKGDNFVDFVKIKTTELTSNNRKSDYLVAPDFQYGRNKDLVARGGMFKAFWYHDKWSDDLYDFVDAIDYEIGKRVKELQKLHPDKTTAGLYIRDHKTGLMTEFERFLKNSGNTLDAAFDQKIIFADQEVKREDYSLRQLSYSPKEGSTKNFDEMLGKLYSDVEREKIEWFLGAVLTGKIADIQKFMYLYGSKGSGKGTVIDIFRMLFEGYYSEIDLGDLTSGKDFSSDQVKEVPLLVDPDSDISSIKNDTPLLKLTAHEPLQVNRKYQIPYQVQFHGLLITASNQPYKVRNVDSGITRRAVVVRPTEETFTYSKYKKLFAGIKTELAAIAYKTMKKFEEMGPSYYENSTDVEMMENTDIIFSFIRDNYAGFGEPTTLKRVAELYKLYLEDLGWDIKGYKRRIKTELQRYYRHFDKQKRIDGEMVRNVYSDFKYELVFPEGKPEETPQLQLEANSSTFDEVCAQLPAQYATKNGLPKVAWDKCTTVLSDLDTSELHYVQIPENHIVIDFDLRGVDGEKDLKQNLQEATNFPETYAELSKSGKGVHLHYIYDGDVEKLARLYKDRVEIKVFTGKQSLRRKLTKCNHKEITHISGGLPIKEEAPKVYADVEKMIWNEKKMRTAIKKNLRKEYHANTKPSMDFIVHIFEEAEKGGVEYDLSDMRKDIIAFAASSTNNAAYCLKASNQINYSTIRKDQELDIPHGRLNPDDSELIFFDLEVYQNLFLIGWKRYGQPEKTVWYNPTPAQIEWLTSQPIVGFNNRRYDNHILYGRIIGENNMQLFHRSQDIIVSEVKGAGFSSSAYELSYADIYDYSNKKQSLKKWEVQLGLKHDEFEFDFNAPLPEDKWSRAAEYMCHDIDATEETFKATYADYEARKILSELTGLSVNTPTTAQASRFLFGKDPRPQDKFVYTDLSTIFPGYKFEGGKSSYRGENPSEGGYVYSETGVYKDVVEIDISSMHPSSAIALNYFGPYTQQLVDLREAKNALKHHELEKASKLFGGILKPYLGVEENIPKLAYAMKIVINIIYGMTSAKFDNKFKHPKNIDNIIAKRGALFMINLKHIVQEAGYQVVHIKTDSIKIADADKKIIQKVIDYGKEYQYDFEVEHKFSIFALVNKAVNVGRVESNPKWGKESGQWQAIGAQYLEPYVFKKLFTKEDILEKDYAMTKQVKSSMYLDDEFVGRIAEVYCSRSGRTLVRKKDPDDKPAAVTGTKGFKWELFENYKGPQDIDVQYYDLLAEAGIKSIMNVAEDKELAKSMFGVLSPTYAGICEGK